MISDGAGPNHKVYGEAMAILAGDAMTTLAFEILATDSDPSVARACSRTCSCLRSGGNDWGASHRHAGEGPSWQVGGPAAASQHEDRGGADGLVPDGGDRSGGIKNGLGGFSAMEGIWV